MRKMRKIMVENKFQAQLERNVTLCGNCVMMKMGQEGRANKFSSFAGDLLKEAESMG